MTPPPKENRRKACIYKYSKRLNHYDSVKKNLFIFDKTAKLYVFSSCAKGLFLSTAGSPSETKTIKKSFLLPPNTKKIAKKGFE